MGVRLTIEEMRSLARARNGKCLSKQYVNNTTHLRWKCSAGHIWSAAPLKIKQGQWCKPCSIAAFAKKRKLNINEMHELAQAKNGRCLSKTYVDSKTRLAWQCSEGHVWRATPSNVKNNNSWCRECAGFKKLTIEYMHKIAKKRKGMCLSNEYFNSSTVLKWQCSEGHVFSKTAAAVLNRGEWCGECKKGNFLSEELCRTTFEQLFNCSFPKVKPKWLKNAEQNLMELDGFSEKLKLAFEYQGKQHYQVGHFTKTKALLKKRFDDDKLKLKLCKENNIKLMIISYKQDLLRLPSKIQEECIKAEVSCENVDFRKEINFNKVYDHKNIILELQNLAKKKKGECLSERYIDSTTRLKWKCKEGHIWTATRAQITKGSWCRKCSGLAPLGINLMHELASKRNGKCLSKTYINNRTKLIWECSEGHIFEQRPKQTKRGEWCKICAGNLPLNLKDMQEIARKRNGKCLSEKYISSSTSLSWQCEEGHVWSARPADVKRGSWCKKCWHGRNKKT